MQMIANYHYFDIISFITKIIKLLSINEKKKRESEKERKIYSAIEEEDSGISRKV